LKAQTLFEAGKLDEAIQSLGVELRDNPTDVRRRIFLFELLSLAGEYDRAEKHLDVVAQGSHEAGMGALLYHSALHAARTRRDMFRSGDLPTTSGDQTVPGTLNGKPFQTLYDADPRIGPRIEIFAAGQYTWIPLEHVASITMEPPKRLRDLIWAPARVVPGPKFRELELGEVLIPALTPFAYEHDDPEIRMGRATDWEALDGDEGFAPVGQKLFMVDDKPVPLLDVRHLEFHAGADAEE
jgi:type VI secretion system protein ImpE